jgi:hypothetical protein
MKKTILLLLISLFSLSAVHAQKTLIGTVDYSYKIKGEGAEQMAGMMPSKMIIKYGENGLTMEMQGGMMAASMGKTVVNGETSEAFMVKESEKTIYLMGEAEINAAADLASDPDIKEFDETKTILGYECKKYTQSVDVQGNSMTQTLWVTKELSPPDYKGDVFKSMSMQGGLSFDLEGFPMLVEVDMPGMPMTLELEVTNIDFGKISKKEFEKPKGFEEKPFSEMNPF